MITKEQLQQELIEARKEEQTYYDLALKYLTSGADTFEEQKHRVSILLIGLMIQIVENPKKRVECPFLMLGVSTTFRRAIEKQLELLD